MSEPTSSDVHVEGTSWKFKKPDVSRSKRRRGRAHVHSSITKAKSSGVEALTNTIADARLPGYVKSLRAALKVLRGGLADDAGTIAALKKLDARTLDGLQSFRDFVETLTSGAEKELLTTLAATGAAGARAADLAGFSFDIMNEAALAWAKARAADLVTAISERTRDGIKKIVENAYQLEKDVPSTARDIRGRLERDLGNFGGLTERDATAVDRFRAKLIDNEVDPDTADAKAAKLADGYRRDRSETIARTELIAASNQGQLQLWQQAVEGGLLDDGARREWILTDDSITCPTCEAIVADYPDGVAMDETFTTEDGDELDGPPAHPRCRCTTALVSGRGAIAQATGEAGADNPVQGAINDAEEEVSKFIQFMKGSPDQPRDESGKWVSSLESTSSGLKQIARPESGVWTVEEAIAVHDFINTDKFKRINDKLRAGKKLSKDDKLRVQSIEKLPAYDGTVWRGEHPFTNDPGVRTGRPASMGELRDKYPVGKVLEDPGFTSTSMSRDVGIAFASGKYTEDVNDWNALRTSFESEQRPFARGAKKDPNETYPSLLFKIASKTGRDLSPASSHKLEQLVVFSPGTRFEVTKFEPHPQGNNVIVHLSEVSVKKEVRSVELVDWSDMAPVAKQSPTLRSLFASRPVVNPDDLRAWAISQGFVLADEPHVTLAYSKEPVDWPEPDQNEVKIEGGHRSIAILGDGAVGLMLGVAPRLRRRWAELKLHGAEWSWPTYRPHVTVTTVDQLDRVHVNSITTYRGPIVLGPEEFKEIEEIEEGA